MQGRKSFMQHFLSLAGKHKKAQFMILFTLLPEVAASPCLMTGPGLPRTELCIHLACSAALRCTGDTIWLQRWGHPSYTSNEPTKDCGTFKLLGKTVSWSHHAGTCLFSYRTAWSLVLRSTALLPRPSEVHLFAVWTRRLFLLYNKNEDEHMCFTVCYHIL